jgi:hypothetical protein
LLGEGKEGKEGKGGKGGMGGKGGKGGMGGSVVDREEKTLEEMYPMEDLVAIKQKMRE